MATEDERYRQSSQFRLWSFSPAALQELREKTNGLARQQIAPRLQADPLPEFLTADEEVRLVKFYTSELIRAAEFINLPAEIRATAAIFLRRFYVTNSVMTYPPTEILKTSLFFGCKAEGYFLRLAKFVEDFPNTTQEQILAGEFLLCQGIRFAFDVRHPFRALEGAIMELNRKLPSDDETSKRINHAHVRAREFLKFSALLTDVYFHFTPSQIMMAALEAADAELLHTLFPAPSNDETSFGAHTDLREKVFETIKACRHMLEEEPPERQQSFWAKPDGAKSIKAPRRKLTKCRDPDRADLVALQKARREQANKPKPSTTTTQSDGAVFGDVENRDAKRRKLEDPFGPALG